MNFHLNTSKSPEPAAADADAESPLAPAAEESEEDEAKLHPTLHLDVNGLCRKRRRYY